MRTSISQTVSSTVGIKTQKVSSAISTERYVTVTISQWRQHLGNAPPQNVINFLSYRYPAGNISNVLPLIRF